MGVKADYSREGGGHTRISLVGVEEEVCSRYQNEISVCLCR